MASFHLSEFMRSASCDVDHKCEKLNEKSYYIDAVGHDLSSKHHMPISDIDGDFENALKYARSSEYALHEPKLQTVSYRIQCTKVSAWVL